MSTNPAQRNIDRQGAIFAWSKTTSIGKEEITLGRVEKEGIGVSATRGNIDEDQALGTILQGVNSWTGRTDAGNPAIPPELLHGSRTNPEKERMNWAERPQKRQKRKHAGSIIDAPVPKADSSKPSGATEVVPKGNEEDLVACAVRTQIGKNPMGRIRPRFFKPPPVRRAQGTSTGPRAHTTKKFDYSEPPEAGPTDETEELLRRYDPFTPIRVTTSQSSAVEW